jgi:hypothetical protein
LWYIDQLSVVSDGAGSSTVQGTTLAVDQPASFNNVPNFSPEKLPRSGKATVDTDSVEGATAAVGAYGTGGESVRIIPRGQNDAGEITFTALIRRIL